jgi:DNA-binding NarL/FixJ family response regulator
MNFSNSKQTTVKPKQYHILERNIHELKRLYQTDMTLVKIAQTLKVSKTTLQQKIKELGWQRKPCFKKKSINQKKLKELLELGFSDRKIQEKLHIGRYVLIRCKKELGAYSRNTEGVLKGKKGAAYREHYKKTGDKPECPCYSNILEKYSDDVILLLKKGTPRTEIAQKYNVSKSTVFNFIHLYGINEPIKKTCDEHENFIQKAFHDGKTLTEIAKQLNCCPETISRYIRKKGLKRSQKNIIKKSFLNSNRELVFKLYQDGLSGDEIASKLNVSKQSIYSCIKRFKFVRTKKMAEYPSVFKGYDKELLQMRKNGMTLKQIANIFGVKDNTVSRRLKKLEINHA